jgi:hypothetical protein
MLALAGVCTCVFLAGCQSSPGFIDSYVPTTFVPVNECGDSSSQDGHGESSGSLDRRIDDHLGQILRCHTKEEIEAILGPATKGVPLDVSTILSRELEIWHRADDRETFLVAVDARGQVVDQDLDRKNLSSFAPCIVPRRTFLDCIRDQVTSWLGR